MANIFMDAFLSIFGLDAKSIEKKSLTEAAYKLPSAGMNGVMDTVLRHPEKLAGWGFFTGLTSSVPVGEGRQHPYLQYDFPPGFNYRSDAAGNPEIVGIVIDVRYGAALAVSPPNAQSPEDLLCSLYSANQLLDDLAADICRRLFLIFDEHKVTGLSTTTSIVPSQVKFGDELRSYVRINFVDFPPYFLGYTDKDGKRAGVYNNECHFHPR